MTGYSSPAAIADPAPNNSDCVINVPATVSKVGDKKRRRCIRAGLVDQLFTGPELAKLLLTLCYAGILATPVISYNHSLPEHYLCLISILLLVGFFALFSATVLRETFPDPAGTLGLIGTACVVSVIPAITAGVLPKLGVLVWIFFLLLLVTAILLVVLLHITGERVSGIPEGNSDSASEIGVSKKQIHRSIAPIEEKLATPPTTEVKLATPPTTEVKLGSEDEAQTAEFWNSAVVCTVPGANPPLRHMKGFFRWIWGRHGIDKIYKLQNGVFLVRFRAYSKALKVAEGQGVMFDGKPVITKLCEPNLVNGVTDQCRKKSATAKKVWVAKTSGIQIQQVHAESAIKTADKGKLICVGS